MKEWWKGAAGGFSNAEKSGRVSTRRSPGTASPSACNAATRAAICARWFRRRGLGGKLGSPSGIFQFRNGWQCSFLGADLKTSLPRHLPFASSEKIIELVTRGGGFKDQEARLMLDQGIEKGRGGVFLELTEEQFAKLKSK